MSNNINHGSVVFLLGAGFNVDAASESGNPMALSSRSAKYPLVGELLDICFNLKEFPHGKSIEDLFQESINRGQKGPLKSLYENLMEADYYITPHLKSEGGHQNNAYLTFLRDFPKSPLITFNYDSLPEILLLTDRAWCPEDGYGVPVQAERKTIRRGAQPIEKSLRPVLHLHGSLCVYPSTFYVERTKTGPDMLRFDREPDFMFDPDSLGNCFFPFERVLPGVTYTYPDDRVIAPVPDKAQGLKGEFIEAVYSQALKCLGSASQIISIGYSFNRNDLSSYGRLLASIIDKPVLIVDPAAGSMVERLVYEYRAIRWNIQNMSFKEWVNSDYPGLQR